MSSATARLADAKQKLAEWRQVKTELPGAREKLTEQTHRLQRVEACVDEVEQQVRSLESFTLTSLIDSLLGHKQRKLDARRAELEELASQLADAQAALSAVEQQVQDLETTLAQFDEAEESFHAACEEQAQAILERGGEPAQRLAQITQDREAAQAALRGAQKAVETGRQLSKHLESLDRAVRNAKHNRAMAGALTGAVGAVIKGSVASMGPKSAIRYVSDALQRFVRDVGELPLSDHHDDVDLARIRAELEAFQARLTAELSGITTWDQIATLPVRQSVQVAMSHLKDWVDELQTQVAAWDQQRLALLEST